jgi:hypothetical protein
VILGFYVIFTVIWLFALITVLLTQQEMAAYMLFAYIFGIGIAIYFFGAILFLIKGAIEDFKDYGQASNWKLFILVLLIAVVVYSIIHLAIYNEFPEWIYIIFPF